MNVPATVGVPLMVMVFEAHAAAIPAGKLIGAPILVDPVVVYVSVSAVLIHRVCGVDAPAVISGVTVMVPVALTIAQPPVSGIL